MAKYLVTQQATYYDTFLVEADSPEHAKEIVLDGEGNLQNTAFSHADLDSNNLEVEEI